MRKIIWCTGLSGAGKSTVCAKLKEELEAFGKRVTILDGDIIRGTINSHLGFDRESVRINDATAVKLAGERLKEYDIVLVSIISPFREDRQHAREFFGKNFVELFVNCPLEKCIERDTKGLYTKAKKSEINNLIGFSEGYPYEVPKDPDLEIRTDLFSLEENIDQIIKFLCL